MGQRILESCSIHFTEIFSLTPAENTIYPSWGISVVYALIYNLGGPWLGLKLLILFHAIILFILLLIIFKKTLSHENRWRPSNLIIILLGFYCATLMFANRPALVAFIPFIAIYYILESKTKFRSKDYLGIYLITAIWININASAILVPFLILWKIGTQFILYYFNLHEKQKLHIRPYLLGLVASLLGIHTSPYGFSIWNYYQKTSLLSKSRFIGEWSSPFALNFPATEIVFFVIVIFLIGYFLREIFYKKNYFAITSLTLPLLALGLSSTRHLIWTGISLIPYFCSNIQPSKFMANDRPRTINYFFIAALVALLFLLNPFYRPNFVENFDSKTFRYSLTSNLPIKEIEYLKTNYQEKPIFVNSETAGLLELMLKSKILFDSRNIIFIDEAYQNYVNVINATPEWESILENYKIDVVLLDSESKSLLKKLFESKNWTIVTNGPVFSLFTRKVH